MNNFSDCASSLTSLAGFKMSSKEADREHPYGHGRIEYIAGLIVAFLIISVAFDFFISSVNRIISPAKIEYSVIILVILLFSLVVKLLIGIYYLKTSHIIHSLVLKASAYDSFGDIGVTLVAITAFVLSRLSTIPFDGFAGILVSIFMFIGGIRMVKDTLNPLLGHSPDQATVDSIVAKLNDYDNILGVHDLLVHDYGPGRTIASVHAEIPMDISFSDAHTLIDKAESAIKRDLGINIVIHGDPVDTKDPELQRIRFILRFTLKSIDPALAYHDLRINDENGRSQLTFDLVVPFGKGRDAAGLLEKVSETLRQTIPEHDFSITPDRQ
jgi:cation diffusion facilitator family transporter